MMDRTECNYRYELGLFRCVRDSRVKPKRYSAEFKRQALKRADEPGVTDVLVCEELGVSARQLGRWRESFRPRGPRLNVT